MITLANFVLGLVFFIMAMFAIFMLSMLVCALMDIEEDPAFMFVKHITGGSILVLAFIGFSYLIGYIY